ncbi:hypothetical protein NM688_g2569 [Phlebia brevispora]|uniref:Uncharacterized protein n=1 Tax=Phlebia brevispora TaxID=194682 RepID=A0ACC1T849_9APHY|nr:hypothetical protein NM688_g2569 [Phlebia brevispora]
MSHRGASNAHGLAAHRSMDDAERGYTALTPAESSGSMEGKEQPGDAINHSTGNGTPQAKPDGAQVSIAREFWDRFTGKDKNPVGWIESFKNVITSSWLNLLFIFVPFAWASHFMNEDGKWPHQVTFALCFLSIIPMENLFDWGGEQMAIYLGKDLGDLATITLNNAVEAALAIILLIKCELRLLQSTIIAVVGVVVLHLLLIPGTAFLAGGAHIWEQNLHPHTSQLNLSLLTIGVLTILLPTAWFAALDRGAQSVVAATGKLDYSGNLLTDAIRDQLLRMSRGLAVILLLVYVASRIFLHDPPGEGNALKVAPNAPQGVVKQEEHLKEEQPKINTWACLIMLAVTVAIMAATAEFLVESIENVRESGHIQEEWFGLILLPIVSFAGDGCIAIAFFAHKIFNHYTGRKRIEPDDLAKGRAIDLSIQFTLWWMPFLVLLGWWIKKPLHLMFDFFEVALLLGASFLVNYVTADAKTNWVEGLIMIAFYLMIAICAWFYEGQPELGIMLTCHSSVAAALIAESSGESAPEVLARFVYDL